MILILEAVYLVLLLIPTFVTIFWVARVTKQERAKSVVPFAELQRRPAGESLKIVKRNIDRFPEDFTFQLTDDEVAGLRFHFETSKRGRGGGRYRPSSPRNQSSSMELN